MKFSPRAPSDLCTPPPGPSNLCLRKPHPDKQHRILNNSRHEVRSGTKMTRSVQSRALRSIYIYTEPGVTQRASGTVSQVRLWCHCACLSGPNTIQLRLSLFYSSKLICLSLLYSPASRSSQPPPTWNSGIALLFVETNEGPKVPRVGLGDRTSLWEVYEGDLAPCLNLVMILFYFWTYRWCKLVLRALMVKTIWNYFKFKSLHSAGTLVQVLCFWIRFFCCHMREMARHSRLHWSRSFATCRTVNTLFSCQRRFSWNLTLPLLDAEPFNSKRSPHARDEITTVKLLFLLLMFRLIPEVTRQSRTSWTRSERIRSIKWSRSSWARRSSTFTSCSRTTTRCWLSTNGCSTPKRILFRSGAPSGEACPESAMKRDSGASSCDGWLSCVRARTSNNAKTIGMWAVCGDEGCASRTTPRCVTSGFLLRDDVTLFFDDFIIFFSLQLTTFLRRKQILLTPPSIYVATPFMTSPLPLVTSNSACVRKSFCDFAIFSQVSWDVLDLFSLALSLFALSALAPAQGSATYGTLGTPSNF